MIIFCLSVYPLAPHCVNHTHLSSWWWAHGIKNEGQINSVLTWYVFQIKFANVLPVRLINQSQIFLTPVDQYWQRNATLLCLTLGKTHHTF